MAQRLQLKFDPNQDYQLQAIESTVNLFKGMPEHAVDFQMGAEIAPNLPEYQGIEEEWLLQNLNAVRKANGFGEQMSLDVDDGFMLEGVAIDSWRYPQFTIEMETGTGKTYIYLRTIYELKKRYGFRKFIIIVPSIAIYEGVIKSFEITRSHFRTLYGNENVHLTRYSGDQLSKLRGFATSSFTEVMVMTLDSFNKKANNIFKATEKLPGEMLPFEYIQKTRPILILDECQNYRSEKAKQALRTLKPLFSLNYSATPMDRPNLIYRLTPVDAFKQNLVKKIEVLGVKEQYQYSGGQMSLMLKSIDLSGYGPTAKVNLFVNKGGELVYSELDVRKNDDLYQRTGNENYRGLIIDVIDKTLGTVIFTNQEQLTLHEMAPLTLTREETFRVQIEQTLKYHFQRQKELLARGIKVLSLFFIDRVANYTDADGIIKKLFDQAFERFKSSEEYFKNLSANDVREGYFAKKKVKNEPVEFVDTHIEDSQKTAIDKKLEKEAYELIMKEKERLLSLDEKVCFIFAHSALKEGWDNPNVFQICTLNQTRSEMKKRQEIGRGLRLAVDQNGERILGDDVNVLTVVANESYEDYVNQLQTEYRETGDAEPPPPSKARPAYSNRNEKIFKKVEFQRFWEKLCQKTEYQINFDTEDFITNCVNTLERTEFPEPQLVISKGKFIITDIAISIEDIKPGKVQIKVEITDTEGDFRASQHWYQVGDDLVKKFNDPRLKGFKVVEILHDGINQKVFFGDKSELALKESVKFQSEKGQQAVERSVHEAQQTYPVFNLIDRTIRETNLTRPTILRIFKKLSIQQKNQIFKNPEGFANKFITTIKDLLADHIAENVQYSLKEGLEDYDIEAIFPPSQKFPQKELIAGTDWSLYDHVQIDSDVEKRFVQHRLNEDDNIVCYFKFPYKFKINLPKIIGNYNPDWGIIRWDDEHRLTLELVRETKGQKDYNLLQYQHEPRKIKCAEKHFKAIRVDYKHIDDSVVYWWK
ncbi:MAG: DEAD/DEAH box helicase family protein [Candidatus Zhuqueibacterota bacterium]